MRTKTLITGSLMAASTNDLDLLSRIKRRDPSAMGDLYDRYGKIAYTVILRIVQDQVVAEDLLAETLVTIWNQIARWKDARIEDLRLWLLLLARRQALEHLRSHNEELPKAIPRLTTLTQPSVLQDFPRPRTPEEWGRLQNAFANLTEKECQILEMACFDGMSTNEIALNLGEPLAVIKETVKGALSKLSAAGHEI